MSDLYEVYHRAKALIDKSVQRHPSV